jgi:hypothetical protein
MAAAIGRQIAYCNNIERTSSWGICSSNGLRRDKVRAHLKRIRNNAKHRRWAMGIPFAVDFGKRSTFPPLRWERALFYVRMNSVISAGGDRPTLVGANDIAAWSFRPVTCSGSI